MSKLCAHASGHPAGRPRSAVRQPEQLPQAVPGRFRFDEWDHGEVLLPIITVTLLAFGRPTVARSPPDYHRSTTRRSLLQAPFGRVSTLSAACTQRGSRKRVRHSVPPVRLPLCTEHGTRPNGACVRAPSNYCAIRTTIKCKRNEVHSFKLCSSCDLN